MVISQHYRNTRNLVSHWEHRRDTVAPFIADPSGAPTSGKSMIVGDTLEICANLYAAITALRPEWHSDELDNGKIKVVYSGTASNIPPCIRQCAPRLGK